MSEDPTLPQSRWTSTSASTYAQIYATKPGPLTYLSHFLALLPPPAPNGTSAILDAGCGTGIPIVRRIVESRRKVIGVDISEDMLSLARANLHAELAAGMVEFVRADMSSYQLPEEVREVGVEGVVVMLSLFEPSREMQEAILREKVPEWLKPGGVLLLGVFCVDDLDGRKYELEWDEDGLGAVVGGFRFLGKEVRFHVFTRKRWVEMLVEGGLEVLREELVVFTPPEEVKGDPGPDYFVLARKPE